MSKSLRLSEKWFRRGLWLVALAFAACLIGLGGLVVDDLPRVEHPVTRDNFIDSGSAAPLRTTIASGRAAEEAAASALDQATLKLQAATQAYNSAREAFTNWLDTRKATNLPDQDGELIARTKALDALKTAQTDAQHRIDAQKQVALDAQQAGSNARAKLDELETAADRRLATATTAADLRVFLYRLALTLPLLVIAGLLFRTARNGTWWPFTWGFIFFAFYAFFVELVPYMPSYGGYIHYGVGLLITVIVGRAVIVGLNNYLARQKLAEQQPDKIRRRELNYDTALARLGKNVCPGCERGVDLKSGTIDFCPHCGIGLFNHCAACTARKSAFAQFCQACGTPPAVVAVP